MKHAYAHKQRPSAIDSHTPTTTGLQEVPEALDQKQIIAEAYDTNLLSRECIASLRKIEAVSKHGTCFRLSLSNSGLILDPLH